MSKNLYKDYYDAMQAPDADEWALERAQSISAKIKKSVNTPLGMASRRRRRWNN